MWGGGGSGRRVFTCSGPTAALPAAHIDSGSGLTVCLLPFLLPSRRAELQLPATQWTVGGTPLLSMMHLERRAGR